MRKKLATLLLFVLVTVGSAGVAHSAIAGNKNAPVCHDRFGKWDPQSKNCDPHSCGCLFHQIEELIRGFFK